MREPSCRRHGRPVRAPFLGTGFASVHNPHRHRPQSIVKATFVANGPPVVEEDLEWPPHRDPAADQQALAHDVAKSAVAERPRSRLPIAIDAPRQITPMSRLVRPTAKELAQLLPRIDARL